MGRRWDGEDCGVRVPREAVERWHELCGIARRVKRASLRPDTALRRLILSQLIVDELSLAVGGEVRFMGDVRLEVG